MDARIEIGARVFLRNAVAGEPGVIVKLYGDRALVEWPDLNLGRPTKHSIDSLVLAEAYNEAQRIDYEGAAA